VIVRDVSGKVVTDLTRSDFEITEDKQPQTILSFESPTEREGTEKSGAARVGQRAVGETSNRARTILLLDEYNTRFADVAYAKQQIKKYLRTNGDTLPQPTALYALSQGRLWQIQNYTLDANELRKALDRHPPSLPRAETSVGYQEELDRFGVCMGVMREIARSQGGVPGRKNLIWLTAGFPEVSGADLRQDSFMRAMQRITNVLMDAHVTLYTIDPRGLQTNVAADVTNSPFNPLDGGAAFQLSYTAQAFEHDLTLEALAGQTGGTAIFARNDIGAMIALDAQSGSEYYALTYDPTNREWNGAYRRIRVKVRRAGLTISTREGYFALNTPPPPTLKEIDLSLKRGMLSPMDYTELPTKAEWKPNTNHRMLKVRLERRAMWWDVSNAGSSYSLQVAIATVAANGKVLADTVREISGTLPRNIIDSKVAVDFDIPITDLPRDTDAVRVAVVDTHTGQMGTSTLALR
jgi:VWFA-related protein